MKILIATFTFPPNKDGISEAASVGVQAFLKRGWTVDIATEPTKPARSSDIWHRAKVHEFCIVGSSYFRRPYRGQILEYQAFLRSGFWDVIIFHGYSWPLYLSLPFLDALPARKILVSHGYSALVWTPTPRFPFGLLFYAAGVVQSLRMLRWLRVMDRLVFLSWRKNFRAFYDHWIASRIRHPGIKIIPNGTNVQNPLLEEGFFRRKWGIRADGVLFLSIANYSLRKDQGFAAKAFRLAAIPNSFLVFIGSELNEAAARFIRADAKLAGHNAPGKVIWLEKVSREETLGALAESDVFVLSANFEGQPIVLLEAMAFRRPWVARKAGCIEDLKGGVCVRNPKAMAEAMRRLAVDPDLRKKLGQEGLIAFNSYYQRKQYETNFCELIEDTVNEANQKKSRS